MTYFEKLQKELNFNLTEGEHEEILHQVIDGSMHAKSKLLEYNLILAVEIAKTYANGSHSNDDLISIATLGLLKAVNSCNTCDTFQSFKEYASRCIKHEMSKFFKEVA